MEYSAIKLSNSKDAQSVDIVRGDSSAWMTAFDVSARELGRQVATELCDLTKSRNDELIVSLAAKLAIQEPPMPIELSWKLYDGVREVLEDRRAVVAFGAQTQGVQNV